MRAGLRTNGGRTNAGRAGCGQRADKELSVRLCLALQTTTRDSSLSRVVCESPRLALILLTSGRQALDDSAAAAAAAAVCLSGSSSPTTTTPKSRSHSQQASKQASQPVSQLVLHFGLASDEIASEWSVSLVTMLAFRCGATVARRAHFVCRLAALSWAESNRVESSQVQLTALASPNQSLISLYHSGADSGLRTSNLAAREKRARQLRSVAARGASGHQEAAERHRKEVEN